MPATILGLGTAVPQHTMSVDEATEMAAEICCDNPRDARRLAMMYKKSGVRNRHTIVPFQTAFRWVHDDTNADVAVIAGRGPTTAERMELYAEHACGIAFEAAEGALHQAALGADQITHIITVSCTGFEAPGTDVKLMTALELAATVERINVGFMGCHGAINGMRVAQAIVEANPRARVLLCAVEICSMHYCFHWDPEKMIANALFADGAAALVIANQCAADNVNGAVHGRLTEGRQIIATGSCLVPDTQHAMTWRIGDYGFEMTLDASIPDLIEEYLPGWIIDWLAQHELTMDAIGGWCVHPGGPRILSAVERVVGLPPGGASNSREILAEYGNMSSPTVLFILQRYWQLRTRGPFVALGFGPGLIAEAALIR